MSKTKMRPGFDELFGEHPGQLSPDIRRSLGVEMGSAMLALAGGHGLSASEQETLISVVDQHDWAEAESLFAMPTRRVVRPDDLLAIKFQFWNLEPEETVESPALVRIDPSTPAVLIARLQGQHIGEQTFLEASPEMPPELLGDNPDPEEETPSASAAALLAGNSSLAFRMPDDVERLPFTLDGLLDAIHTWPMELSSDAAPIDSSVHRDLAQSVIQPALLTISRLLEESFPDALRPKMKAQLTQAALNVSTWATRFYQAGEPKPGALNNTLERELSRALKGIDIPDEDTLAAGRAYLTGQALAKVLDWVGSEPSVTSEQVAAYFPELSNITAPSVDFGLFGTSTSIEIPYRLKISPIASGGLAMDGVQIERFVWAHSRKPVTHGQRTELWHTRLAPLLARVEGGSEVLEHTGLKFPLRALQALPAAGAGDPFRLSLNPDDRHNLVKLTAGFDQPGYAPKPFLAKHLMLSALGGWLECEGSWERDSLAGVDLSGWVHRIGLGRDSFASIVNEGFLFPLGHAAALVSVTERKFQDFPAAVGRPDERVAYLRKRYYVIVREAVRQYPAQDLPAGGRETPFSRVEILTRVTPLLDTPGGNAAGRLQGIRYYPDAQDVVPPADRYDGIDAVLPRFAFWPRTPGQSGMEDVSFAILATDRSGRQVSFHQPLVFLSLTVNQDAFVSDVIDRYAVSGPARTRVTLDGQMVEYAPEIPDSECETSFATQLLGFKGMLQAGAGPERPCYYPAVTSMAINIPALERLLPGDTLSQAPGPNGSFPVVYAAPYIANGFDDAANPGQVFVALDGVEVGLDFGTTIPTDKAGGIATPNMRLTALSRRTGAVSGDAEDFAAKGFDPGEFFAGAKLLGAVDLKDVIVVTGQALADAMQAPRVQTVRTPEYVVTYLKYSCNTLKSAPPLLLVDQGGTSELTIDVRLFSWIGEEGQPLPGQTEVAVVGQLTHFKINLFGFVVVWFDDLIFSARAGEKPVVAPNLNPNEGIVFGGPLGFLSSMSDSVPSAGGFDHGPKIDVSPTGITAGYGLGIPSLMVGAFTLQNIALGAGFHLPFTGESTAPSLRFNFCRREDPFVLSVGFLGGGGFLALGVDAGGIREVEAALEFGAMVALDLGVASGSAYVKGGIYFHYEAAPPEDRVVLEGYVEMASELCVLGLISASIVFHLSLGYYEAGPVAEVRGQARVIVEVSVLFFSASVEITVERRFAGSAPDPKLADFIDEPAWQAYVKAFA